MNTEPIQSYRLIDRAGWPSGPWDTEPDKEQWVDAETGLDCLIVRHPDFGNLCGYVGVSRDHPAFKHHFGLLRDLSCHGGLSYSALCQEGEAEPAVCHAPLPGRPRLVWWLGFDCGHVFDLKPGWATRLLALGIELKPLSAYGFPWEIYCDIEYVRIECANLAEQLKEMES